MNLKKLVLKAAADAAIEAALAACGLASTCGAYQPKEPAALSKIVNNK